MSQNVAPRVEPNAAALAATEPPSAAPLPGRLALRLGIDKACDEFERAWRAGNRTPIEHWASKAPAESLAPLLVELISLEVELRREVGDSPQQEEYLQRFPEVPELVAAAFGAASRCNEKAPQSQASSAPLAINLQETTSVSHGRSKDVPRQIGRYRVQKVLGQGAFGVVFLADDPELDRLVAIKRLTIERFAGDSRFDLGELTERFYEEARNAARLSHPGIVAIYDFYRGSESEQGRAAPSLYIIQEYIAGRDLKSLLLSERLSGDRSVELMLQIASAIDYAHQHHIIHRDLKPANILLDARGNAHVADFGLAVRETARYRHRGEIAGTPGYMSPEQTRGETHRLDGRADVWSLGVMLYEMLTGKLPFVSETRDELYQEIQSRDPLPPRQIIPDLPEELERVCLKCLAKRVSDRCTAAALVDDLEHWRRQHKSRADAAAPPAPPRIVPKGLRSYGPQDADFFLDLLPGPRDRYGMPESLRFWKHRIEDLNSDDTFATGVLYGPSGCGKSSLLKAGLLPRLAPHVLSIYLEATAESIETRLAHALRRRFPEIPAELSLAEAMQSLREGRWLPKGQKLVVVLDQFEQWLHARFDYRGEPLVDALRQCDGGRVQCLMLVRDDFWLALSRFMRDLETPLLEGRNSALVDLFDPSHARKVLTEFGRAYEQLPRIGELNDAQQQFLEQSVASLTEQGKVICVRLALYADMVKHRPWVPATLKELGGAEGVGVAFLEETFHSSHAPPAHRRLQAAAERVLQALLPEPGVMLKGHRRSRDELLEAAGRLRSAEEFDGLLQVLDAELRLITPAESEGASDAVGTATDVRPPSAVAEPKFYQLTHDYLVPSVRRWIEGKQRQTRRGRAELRLTERAALWTSRPEPRNLPSLGEFASICLFVDRQRRTPPQQRMLRQATAYYGVRSGAAVLVGMLLLAAGLFARNAIIERQGAVQAQRLVEGLIASEITRTPALIERLDAYRKWANPLLRERLQNAKPDSDERLRVAMALLPVDPAQSESLFARLQQAHADETSVLRDALAPYKSTLEERLWNSAGAPAARDEHRLPAASALAAWDPESDQWEAVVSRIADALCAANVADLRAWEDALRPVRHVLIAPLEAVYRDRKRGDLERSVAASLLAAYADDHPQTLAELCLDAEPHQFTTVFPALRQHAKAAEAALIAELGQTALPRWEDPALRYANNLAPATVRQIEAAAGRVSEHFAFCQALPLADLSPLLNSLRPAGYRPLRVRPYSKGEETRVAVVWTRDYEDWQFAINSSAEQVRDQNEALQKIGFEPEDVAGFMRENALPKTRAATIIAVPKGGALTYVAVWVKASGEPSQSHMYLDVPEASHPAAYEPLQEAGFVPEVVTLADGADGGRRFSAIWRKRPNDAGADSMLFIGNEADYARSVHASTGHLQVELHQSGKPGAFAAIWRENGHYASCEMHDLSPQEHLRRSRDLEAQGYRPAVISVSYDDFTGASTAASVWRIPIVPEREKEVLAKRQANAAAALLLLGKTEHVWPLFVHQSDPRVRSWLVERLSQLGIDPQQVIDRLATEPETSSRRALILTLGGFDVKTLAKSSRQRVSELLATWRRDDPDPGIHGAAEWLLRQWGERVSPIPSEPLQDGQRWFVNGQGQTMAIMHSPGEFLLGSPASEPDHASNEALHLARIDRRWAISDKEISVEQFRRFMPGFGHIDMRYSPEPNCPIIGVLWYEAAAFCNWLSQQEGLPPDQWCYVPNEQNKYEQGMAFAPDHLRRTGYRLPTEAEWEFACRAGAVTSRCYGASEELLPKYAWCLQNSQERTWPGGLQKPNDFGLFDMHGNLYEWCDDAYRHHPQEADDVEDSRLIDPAVSRVLRGGGYFNHAPYIRSAYRIDNPPGFRKSNATFRVARTLNDASHVLP